jgi:uncharacterized protein
VKAAIDVHVHLAALPTGDNGCYVSPKMRKSLFFRLLNWKLGLSFSDPQSANSSYVTHLLNALSRSKKVGRAVLLAMDGVYGKQGELDWQRTDFLVSNRYVLEVSREHPDFFLPGVSINPQRKDALDEVARCAEKGAVLVKVLPNTQCFDPSDKRYVPFYRALAKYRIPLLSHVGLEFALMRKNQSAGDPRKLRVALDEGVTVIAAHGLSYGLFFFEPYAKVFLEFARRYSNFYADTSALTLPNRMGTLFLLRRRPELFERLIFGTDYPLPVFSYPALGRGWNNARSEETPFDRQVVVLESLGIQYKDFSALGRTMESSRLI